MAQCTYWSTSLATEITNQRAGKTGPPTYSPLAAFTFCVFELPNYADRHSRFGPFNGIAWTQEIHHWGGGGYRHKSWNLFTPPCIYICWQTTHTRVHPPRLPSYSSANHRRLL